MVLRLRDEDIAWHNRGRGGEEEELGPKMAAFFSEFSFCGDDFFVFFL